MERWPGGGWMACKPRNTRLPTRHRPHPACLPACLQVKGHIAKMALCLEDGDERIAALAQLFFHELAKKEYKVGFGVVLEGGVPVRVRA